MKNWKIASLGFVAGAMCMVTTTAIAAGTTVSAFVSGDITFKINGQNVAASSDQPVLNYNDRVYVPMRFVADQLGCKVSWDVVTKQVIVTAPEPEVIEKEVIKEVEKIVYMDPSEAPDAVKVYSSLPVRKIESNLEMEVTGINRMELDQKTKVFFKVKNTGQDRIQIVQSETILNVDGKDYSISPLKGEWDMGWYQDIDTDKTYEGYLLFDMIPEDWKNATLKVDTRTNTGTQPISKSFEFNFRRK